MSRTSLGLLLALAASVVARCGICGPGPLEGTWQMTDPIPMTIVFRDGETEALGVIEQVSYERQGRDVIVTYKNGISEGMAMRYTVVSPDLVRTELGTLRRVR